MCHSLSKMSAGESSDGSDTIRPPSDIYKESLIVQKGEFVCMRVFFHLFFLFFFIFFCYIDLRADLMVHQSLQELICPLYYDLSTER